MRNEAKFCRKCGVPLLLEVYDGMCEECHQFSLMPDALSRRKHLMGIPMTDMKAMDEEDRIKMIASQLRALPGAQIAVIVDCGPSHRGKGDRYLEKVRLLVPKVRVNGRHKGRPVKNVETISLTLPEEAP